jgi:outer membrane receptor protein involved in Fe transport
MGGRVARIVAAALVLAGRVAAEEPAPPATPGTVAGVVIDKTSGDPIIEAGVEVLGQNRTVRTDLDGKYSVKLAPGTYQLRIFAPLYQGTRLQGVVVRAGQVTKADASLASTGTAGVEVVEVVAQAAKAAEATQLLRRQKSAVVSDNVAAETIAKSPDADAAEVVQRVPAVTIKDDKFIFVRGLGERYSSALLNGSRLPSTDPDRRVVPLDLFPADFIESLSIVKSYTPDLPGDFAGGLVDIDLREFPDKPSFGLGLSTGYNSEATFKRFRTYEGPSLDYFGFGSNFRDLPDSVGDDNIQSPPPAKQRELASTFKNIWAVEKTHAPPNSGLNVSAGNTYGPLGIEVGGIYTTEYKRRRDEIQRSFEPSNNPQDPMPVLTNDFRFDTSTFETRLGGILTSALKLGDNHKLTFRSLVNRNSYDETQIGVGQSTQNPDDTTSQSRLKYTAEELDFGQFGGEHHLPWFDVDWRMAAGHTTQDVPDTRSLTYIASPGGPPRFSSDITGGTRLFTTLDELLEDAAADVTIPFMTRLPATEVWFGLPAKFKFGPAYNHRDRTFELRRFRYRIQEGGNINTLPPEELLDPDNVGGPVSFGEETQPRDSFAARQEIIGGYGMFDLPLVRDRLRLIAGVRVEYSLIRLETADDLGNPSNPRKKNVDPLPGVNLVYTPRYDMNVRFAWSRSVSRPDFRELTPTLFPELRALRPVVGNPDLVQAGIENLDLRWEWFFAPNELVSLGGFYKTIDQPIEQVVVVGASDVRDSFQNAGEAKLKGFEIEGRKNFGFLHHRLAYLSFTGNVAYIDASVTVPRTSPLQQQTSTERRLQGQSPFVVNAVLDYTHPRFGTARLLYNTAGPRIVSAGAFGLSDVVEERRNQLDGVLIVPLTPFGLPLTAKLAAENLLADRYLYTEGADVKRRYEAGIKVTFGLSYSF